LRTGNWRHANCKAMSLILQAYYSSKTITE
jgi:hypothetical protein